MREKFYPIFRVALCRIVASSIGHTVYSPLGFLVNRVCFISGFVSPRLHDIVLKVKREVLRTEFSPRESYAAAEAEGSVGESGPHTAARNRIEVIMGLGATGHYATVSKMPYRKESPQSVADGKKGSERLASYHTSTLY